MLEKGTMWLEVVVSEWRRRRGVEAWRRGPDGESDGVRTMLDKTTWGVDGRGG